MSAVTKRWTVYCVCATMFASAGGCATNSDTIALERQLRRKESQVRQLTEKLNETERLLADQDDELAAMRNRKSPSVSLASATSGNSEIPVEVKTAFGSVVDLQIHELTSGIVEGDSANPKLNLILQPVDTNGDLVKVAGALVIRVSTASDKRPPQEIAVQNFSLTESRRLWARGLVASGFNLKVPLPADRLNGLQEMKGGQLIVEATLKLDASRTYSTTATIDAAR